MSTNNRLWTVRHTLYLRLNFEIELTIRHESKVEAVPG